MEVSVRFLIPMWTGTVLLLLAPPLPARDLEECAQLYLTGQYAECAQYAKAAIDENEYSEDWWLWRVRSLLTLGEYPEAKQVAIEGLRRKTTSLRLRLIGEKACRMSGDVVHAEKLVNEMKYYVERTPWRYTSAKNRVAVGQFALRMGADPRQVLELFYDRAKQQDSDLRDCYLAMGELGLDKHDDATAAEAFRAGLKIHPKDPDLHLGLARALASSDAEKSNEQLLQALQCNPAHIPSLLLQVDFFITSEDYEAAEDTLERILAVDPWNAESWAYFAVIAHLRGEFESESIFRSMAVRFWSGNPSVDHLIGKKLSEKYRFSEGAGYQRMALAVDSEFAPARSQLAQDLLRLGEEQEGWALADSLHEQDPYNLESYNLVTLRDNMATFQTIQDESFILRMAPHEAELYGRAVLELLTEARGTLCKKYGLEITAPVTVEIFDDQSDFAVRTFGMPGGAGYLGVCFGKVITANSPASQGDTPSNWESVLWHEFCHVVTLQLTRNKMPRWLSEGISVYEERLANPTWGQAMTPRYKAMIADGALTPVGQLSGAFLRPPSPLHLQFAYYQSSLVVQFLVEQHGHEALVAILQDLANSVEINLAIEAHAEKTIGEFELEFAEFAESLAAEYGKGIEFDREELPGRAAPISRWISWLETNENNYWGQVQYGRALVQAKQWDKARVVLSRAVAMLPDYVEPGSPHMLLASVYRELDQPEEELKVLENLAEYASDALGAYRRLIELATDREDWQTAKRYANRYLAVQPLHLLPYKTLAQVAEETDDVKLAIDAYQRLLTLAPEDPAHLRYRLGYWLYQKGDPLAKHQILLALEEAPRFPDALRLLLEIHRSEDVESKSEPDSKEQTDSQGSEIP